MKYAGYKLALILLFPLFPQFLVGMVNTLTLTDIFALNIFTLSVAFVLQESFRAVKLVFAATLGLFIFYAIVRWIMLGGIERLLNYLASYWNYPELRPLTLALVLITFFTFRIKRKYNFSR